MTEGNYTSERSASPVQKGSSRIIIGNALFLGFMAVFGMSQDIFSYMFGTGRFDTFLLDNPRAVGFVEAHGLAGIIAVAAIVHVGIKPVFWHALLGIVHAFLGTCNLIFFDGYVQTGTTQFATLVTVIHFALAGLHAVMIRGVSHRRRIATRQSLPPIPRQ